MVGRLGITMNLMKFAIKPIHELLDHEEGFIILFTERSNAGYQWALGYNDTNRFKVVDISVSSPIQKTYLIYNNSASLHKHLDKCLCNSLVSVSESIVICTISYSGRIEEKLRIDGKENILNFKRGLTPDE